MKEKIKTSMLFAVPSKKKTKRGISSHTLHITQLFFIIIIIVNSCDIANSCDKQNQINIICLNDKKKGVKTLSLSQCPFEEVMKLWDILIAFGPHLNILSVVSQVILLRDKILECQPRRQNGFFFLL